MLGTPVVEVGRGTVRNKPSDGSTSSSSIPSSSSTLGPITASRIAAQHRGEVRDAAGKRMFHGAFSGGLYADESLLGTEANDDEEEGGQQHQQKGWKPSTFVSHRGARADVTAIKRAARDFMDAEDLENDFAGVLTSKTETYDGIGRRQQQQQEKEQTKSGGAGGGGAHFMTHPSIIPGPMPPELIAPIRTPIGKLLLQACGWREGQFLGPSRLPQLEAEGVVPLGITKKQTPSSSSSQESNEQELEAVWKEGTQRPPGARFGLGYDANPLRMRTDAASALLGTESFSSSAAASSATTTTTSDKQLQHRRLRMSDVLLTNAGSEGSSLLSSILSGKMGQQTKTDANAASGGHLQRRILSSNGNMISGGGGGDDDDDVYSRPSLSQYDIVSKHYMTGADDEVMRQNAKKQRMISNHAAVPLTFSSSSSSNLLLQDDGLSYSSNSTMQLKSNSSTSSATTSSASLFVCADGRPPLPGFHLASRVERGFLDFAKKHTPLPPPPGWVAKHVFEEDEHAVVADGSDIGGRGVGLYARFGYNAQQTVTAGNALKALLEEEDIHEEDEGARSQRTKSSAGASSSGRASNGSEKQSNPVTAQAILSKASSIAATAPSLAAISSSSSFLDDKFTRGPVEGPSVLQPGLLAPPSTTTTTIAVVPAQSFSVSASTFSILPRIGTRLHRSESPWVPSKLLLKRFNVHDPLSRETRDKYEQQLQAEKDALKNAKADRENEQYLRDDKRSTEAVSSTTTTTSANTGRVPSSSSLSDAEINMVAPTLVPFILPRPPAALLHSIFG